MAWLRVAVGLLLAAIYVGWAASSNVLVRRSGLRDGNAAVTVHRLLCAILGVRVRQLGAPGPGRRLIAANHVSWLDVLVLGAMEPMAFLAKKEIGAIRLTRWLVDLQGAIYLDRTRKRCIPIINAKIVRRLLGDAPVVLFAEATTSDGVRVLPFRSSHFEAAWRAQATVQPVYLNYRAIGGLRVTRRDLQTVAWYGDMTFLPSLRKVVACGGVDCDVRYGDVIPWNEAYDRKVLARKAEASMRKLKTLGRK